MVNRILVAICLTAVLAGSASADEVVAYRGATIETAGKAGRIENGTVVVRDGKIDLVGQGISIPDNAKIVDVSGQTIMPGVVDPYHPISVGGVSSAPATRTITIGGRTFTIPNRTRSVSTAFVRIADELDPLSLKRGFKVQSRAGIGFANLVTRGYGQAVHARVTPDEPETAVVNPDGLLYVAVTNSTTSLDLLRKNLGLTGSSSRSGRPPTTTRTSTSSQSRSSTSRRTSSSPTAKLWAEAKDGKKPVIVNVNNAATILHVLKALKPNEKIRIVMVATGPHVYETLDQIRQRKNLSLILRPGLDTAPRSRDRVNVAKMVASAGVDFGFSMSLNSDIPAMLDTPFFPVAMLVKTGLDRDKALAALTTTPAKMLGLEKSLGSVEKGKQANMIFVDGDPLDASTRIQQVMVAGRTVYED